MEGAQNRRLNNAQDSQDRGLVGVLLYKGITVVQKLTHKLGAVLALLLRLERRRHSI